MIEFVLDLVIENDSIALPSGKASPFNASFSYSKQEENSNVKTSFKNDLLPSYACKLNLARAATRRF